MRDLTRLYASLILLAITGFARGVITQAARRVTR